jgi:cell division septation protein DedD
LKSCSLILIFCGLLAIGCSEQRKREAAKLEQEMLAGQSQSSDSIAPDTARTTPAAAKAPIPSDTASAPAGALTRNPDGVIDSSSLQANTASAVTRDTQAGSSTLAAVTAEQAPDVNAVPKENGASARSAMPPHPGAGFWTVQIASSTSKTYSDSVVALFTARGYEPYLAVATVDNRDIYRVRIGRFPTSREAAELRLKLADSYGIQPWVDKVSE